MHPILADRRHLVPYLAPWAVLGLLVAVVLRLETELTWASSLILAVPLLVLHAFICMAAWYPSRASPLGGAHLWKAIFEHLLAALLSISLWHAAGRAWAWTWDNSGLVGGLAETFVAQSSLFVLIGLLLYFLAAASSYLYLAMEASRRAEREAFEARRQQELADQELLLARSLQQRLLPVGELDGDAFQLAAKNIAARGVGGDFYDYFFLPDGTVRLAVADVAGKGMAASLIMATVKAILPLIANERSVLETLRELNRRLAADLAPREFVALAIAGFDPISGDLEIANAGLPDPYLFLAEGGHQALEVAQPRLPLGIRPEVPYESLSLRLGPGDRLLMLTDGLPEAPIAKNEPLGYEAMESFFDHHSDDPIDWLASLLGRLKAATLEDQDDDWTALIFERKESSESAASTGGKAG